MRSRQFSSFIAATENPVVTFAELIERHVFAKPDSELHLDTHSDDRVALGLEHAERGFAVGADEYVTKPFSPSKVVAMARAVLSGNAPVRS